MGELKFKPIPKEDIEVRPTDTKYKGQATLLLYMDSRAAVRILNDTVGAMNWQVEYHGECSDRVYCRLSIWDEEKSQWIVREDVGSESNIESRKGEASDSLKRCLARFGCDYLYTAPRITIKCPDTYYKNEKMVMTFYVEKIEYEDNRISYLMICDKSGRIAFEWSLDEGTITHDTNDDNVQILKKFCRRLTDENGGDSKEIRKFYYYYEKKCPVWLRFDPEALWKKWNKTA